MADEFTKAALYGIKTFNKKVKEEIGMKKLIELFKEYVDNHGTDTKDIEKEYGVIDYGQGFQYGTREYLYEVIVSKKFGFIKWLVENDKIDRYKVEKEKVDYHFIEMFDNDEIMLMLLSISDTPIEDLILYLK